MSDDASVEERLAALERRASLFVGKVPYRNSYFAPGRLQAPASARIGEVVVATNSAASADFAPISQKYRHLHIVCLLRSVVGATIDGTQIRFNGDSGAVYDFVFVSASDNVAPTNGGAFAQTSLVCGTCPGGTAPGNVYAALDILIPYYSSTTVEKHCLIRSETKKGISAGDLSLDTRSGVWRNLGAINRVTVSAQSANLAVGSIVSVYGLS